MPALANPRHERFARAIVVGLGQEPWSQGRAYIAAGYNAKDAGKSGGSAEVIASRLLNKVKPIAARIKELQELASRRTVVTVQSITDELEEARGIAKANDQASAMVAASATKAKIHGVIVDRHEHGTPGAFTEAQSTQAMAEAIIKDRNPSIEYVSETLRESVLVELARHDAALDALAHGDRLAIAQ